MLNLLVLTKTYWASEEPNWQKRNDEDWELRFQEMY